MVAKDSHKPENSEPVVLPGEQVRHIPLTAIFADYDWNVRSVTDVDSDESDGVIDASNKGSAGSGLKGLAENLAQNGQDTPVILRKVEGGVSVGGKKTSLEYELICGFRRFKAVLSLQPEKPGAKSVIPNTADGTILAVVRKLTNSEAQLLNARENTVRSNLKAPDLVRMVKRFVRENMSQTAIASALAINQGYVSKLAKVAALPAPVLAHWRDRQPLPGLSADSEWKQLGIADMIDLADMSKDKTDGETTKRYIDMLRPPSNGGGDETARARKAAERIEAEVKATGRMLGQLVLLGVIKPGSLEFSRVIGPAKNGYLVDSGTSANQARIFALCDMMAEAFKEGATPPKTAAAETSV